MPAVAHSNEESTTRPIHHKFDTPKLRLRFDDLLATGNDIFLKHVEASKDLEKQVQNVLNLLYAPDSIRPGTRSVTFVIAAFEGVAYTTGIELDNDHKEIHFSLNHINAVKKEIRHELLGVICHELVHCFQWDAQGTAPGGLIEGIADWVRLNAGLGAAHWRKEASGNWDQGYQHTGYFLDYLEQRYGRGTVSRINAELREEQYNEDDFWPKCCKGKTVDALWKDYRKSLEQEHDSTPRDPVEPIPTHPSRSS